MHEFHGTMAQAPGAATDAESHVIDCGTLTVRASDPSPMLNASIVCVVGGAPTVTGSGNTTVVDNRSIGAADAIPAKRSIQKQNLRAIHSKDPLDAIPTTPPECRGPPGPRF